MAGCSDTTSHKVVLKGLEAGKWKPLGAEEQDISLLTISTNKVNNKI